MFPKCFSVPQNEQDKWRNMSVTAHGLGSREKARIALKNSRQTTKHDGTSMVVVKDIENEVLDVEPLAAYSEPPQISSQKKSISRLLWLLLYKFLFSTNKF